MKLFKKAKKGFTLVELVVVIAVIAILAAVSVGAYFGVTESAKNSKAEQEAKALHTTIMLVVNDPDSTTKLVNGALTATDATKVSTFINELEAMSGLDFGVATEDTNGKWTIADDTDANDPSGSPVGGIFVGTDLTKVTYVSTDLVEKVITVATGDIN